MPFPPLGVTEELRLLVDLAGLSPLAALQAATTNAATALRRNDQLGSVEAGYLADLVLLDANPLESISNVRRVDAVVANGRLYDHRMIDALLARMGTPLTK
jgi:imidazolonepropionase-like amidohydrolase